MRLKLNFEQIIFRLLPSLLILTALPYGTVQGWWEAVFIIYILILFCLRAIRDAFQSSWVWKGKNITLPLLALAFFALLQSVPIWTAADGRFRAISADPLASRFFAVKILALAIYLELLLRFTNSQMKLKILVFTVIGVALGSAVFGIVRELFLAGAAEFVLPALKPDVGFAQFINRNHFTLLMAMAGGLVLGLITGSKRRQLKIFYAGLALILVSGLALTASKGGVFTFIVQVLFLLLLYSFNAFERRVAETDSELFGGKKRIWNLARQTVVSMALFLVILSGVIWIGGEKMAQRFERLPEEVVIKESSTGATRLNLWIASWNLFKENPVAGVGFGAYKYAIPKHFEYSGRFRFEQAHNDYVELLVSGGLVGAALAIWFVIALTKQARKVIGKPGSEARFMKLGALTGLVGVIIHSFVDFGLHTTINALVCVILIAVLAGEFEDKEDLGASLNT